MNRIYLDNAATSWPKAPDLGTVMANYIENDCVNLNRTESAKSFEVFSWLYQLRENICTIYNYNYPECVIFTKNVTESLNWVIKGLLKEGDTVAVSGWEHNSVMRPVVQLGLNYRIFTDDYEKVITKGVKAVIFNPASNVSGRILDYKAISRRAKECGCLLILDCAQATPFVDIDMEELGADAVCFTGHKCLLGPQGTGGFVIRKELSMQLKPLLSGGSGTESDSLEIPKTMPERLTCGTENLVGLKGLAHSVDYVLKHKEELKIRARKNTEYLYSKLEKLSFLKIIGPTLEEPRTNVISIVSDKFDVADLAAFLSENGVETRVGLHCSPLAHRSEGTYPQGTLRFSPGPFNTAEEIDCVSELIRQFV